MSDEKDDVTAHSTSSVLREVILEHLFVGEVLRRLWVRGITDAEILHSEFDAGGYDVVLSHRRVTRHIQLKSKLASGKAAEVKVSLNLAAKPSGCVVWMIANLELGFESFLWFGGAPGEPLPDISHFRVARHTKGDADGHKLERGNHRVVPKSKFTRLATIDAVIARLLDLQPGAP